MQLLIVSRESWMPAYAVMRSARFGAGSAPAHAQSVADFYKGKNISLAISFSPGGGYDLYARTLARHIGKHIPGNPQIVPQNMPGAGGLARRAILLSGRAQGRPDVRHLHPHGRHRAAVRSRSRNTTAPSSPGSAPSPTP